MKKLALLLFIGGLFAIGFTNNSCKRKDSGDVTISGDTQTTSTKIDSTGEDVHVLVKQGTITSNLIAVGATVYLINNNADEDSAKFEPNYTYDSKLIKVATTDGNGIATFTKVKPASGVDFPGRQGEYYTYFVHVTWENPQTFITETGFNDPGQTGASNPITVSINNGLNNAGLQVTVAVQ